MSSFTKTFPLGTLVIRTNLTVTSIVSKKPGEKLVCDAICISFYCTLRDLLVE